nr:helix-turn-helix domain-containing protein [Pedobacter kyonggii]
MNREFFTTLDGSELKNLIRDCVNEAITGLNLNASKSDIINQKQILSRKETAQLLNISLPTLHSYTNQGFINAVKIGKSIRYRLNDINNSLTLMKAKGAIC